MHLPQRKRNGLAFGIDPTRKEFESGKESTKGNDR